MRLKNILFSASLLLGCLSTTAAGERLVILHTNDTHSQIDPDDRDRGGILRRKVLIDSVRGVEPNVLLVDAGDAVQGTLFFSLFNGEVERKMMNNLGYDMQILGNHEFDNGMDLLAKEWKQLSADLLASNYDFTGSPMDGVTRPFVIRKYGDRTFGFIAINIDPKGIIDDKKSKGTRYLDGVKMANRYASILKEDYGVDMVIALTHIGYDGTNGYNDMKLASLTRNIDVIIGGHSHTTIDPDSPTVPDYKFVNLDGDTVLLTQTGSRGVNLGEVVVDLETMRPSSRLIPVDSRLDKNIDAKAAEILKPYRAAIDSIQSIVIGECVEEFVHGDIGLVNLVTDFVYDEAHRMMPGSHIDLCIMNRGGIRCGIPVGPITQGRIMMMLPFDNRLQILDIKGSDLIEALEIHTGREGEGVSKGLSVKRKHGKKPENTFYIDGERVAPECIYRVATIDYLADGGDYLTPLKRGKKIALSDDVLYELFIRYFSEGPLKGKPIRPDNEWRVKL